MGRTRGKELHVARTVLCTCYTSQDHDTVMQMWQMRSCVMLKKCDGCAVKIPCRAHQVSQTTYFTFKVKWTIVTFSTMDYFHTSSCSPQTHVTHHTILEEMWMNYVIK